MNQHHGKKPTPSTMEWPPALAECFKGKEGEEASIYLSLCGLDIDRELGSYKSLRAWYKTGRMHQSPRKEGLWRIIQNSQGIGQHHPLGLALTPSSKHPIDPKAPAETYQRKEQWTGAGCAYYSTQWWMAGQDGSHTGGASRMAQLWDFDDGKQPAQAWKEAVSFAREVLIDELHWAPGRDFWLAPSRKGVAIYGLWLMPEQLESYRILKHQADIWNQQYPTLDTSIYDTGRNTRIRAPLSRHHAQHIWRTPIPIQLWDEPFATIQDIASGQTGASLVSLLSPYADILFPSASQPPTTVAQSFQSWTRELQEADQAASEQQRQANAQRRFQAQTRSLMNKQRADYQQKEWEGYDVQGILNVLGFEWTTKSFGFVLRKGCPVCGHENRSAIARVQDKSGHLNCKRQSCDASESTGGLSFRDWSFHAGIDPSEWQLWREQPNLAPSVSPTPSDPLLNKETLPQPELSLDSPEPTIQKISPPGDQQNQTSSQPNNQNLSDRVSLQEAYPRLQQHAREVLDFLFDQQRPLHQTGLALLGPDTGAGKTYLTVSNIIPKALEILKQQGNPHILLSAPTKEKCRELVFDLKTHLTDTRVFLFGGRDETNCLEEMLPKIRATGELGLSPKTMVCAGCPQRISCNAEPGHYLFESFRARRALRGEEGPCVIVSTHKQAELIQQEDEHRLGLWIFDENPCLNWAAPKYAGQSLWNRAFRRARKLLCQRWGDPQLSLFEATQRTQKVEELLGLEGIRFFQWFLGEHCTNYRDTHTEKLLFNGAELHHLVDAAYHVYQQRSSLSLPSLDELLELTELLAYSLFTPEYQEGSFAGWHPEAIRSLVGLLPIQLIQTLRNERQQLHKIQQQGLTQIHGSIGLYLGPDDQGGPCLRLYQVRFWEAMDEPVLVCDADARYSTSLYQWAFQTQHWKLWDQPVSPDPSVTLMRYQLNTSKRAMRHRLHELIDRGLAESLWALYLRGHKETLVWTFEEFKKPIQERLELLRAEKKIPPDMEIHLEHLWGSFTKGVNHLASRFSSSILFGTPTPNLHAIEDAAHAWLAAGSQPWDEDRLLLLHRELFTLRGPRESYQALQRLRIVRPDYGKRTAIVVTLNNIAGFEEEDWTIDIKGRGKANLTEPVVEHEIRREIRQWIQNHGWWSRWLYQKARSLKNPGVSLNPSLSISKNDSIGNEDIPDSIDDFLLQPEHYLQRWVEHASASGKARQQLRNVEQNIRASEAMEYLKITIRLDGVVRSLSVLCPEDVPPESFLTTLKAYFPSAEFLGATAQLWEDYLTQNEVSEEQPQTIQTCFDSEQEPWVSAAIVDTSNDSLISKVESMELHECIRWDSQEGPIWLASWKEKPERWDELLSIEMESHNNRESRLELPGSVLAFMRYDRRQGASMEDLFAKYKDDYPDLTMDSLCSLLGIE